MHMMINKRLIGTVPDSKKYIAGNVVCQWVSLAANITLMVSITHLLARLFEQTAGKKDIAATLIIGAAAVSLRFLCTTLASKMSYLSSKAVKKTLREMICAKLLRLGASYSEQVKTSEVVQVAVEGVDQLETYFGAYLPQFFYAMLAPLTLFIVLSFVNLPSAVVLLVCVPLIPVAIVAVQRWAKKLLSKYWGQYTALGDTFLENLQGLTTLKIYQADGFKQEEMNAESEKFRRITMKVLTIPLYGIFSLHQILLRAAQDLTQGRPVLPQRSRHTRLPFADRRLIYIDPVGQLLLGQDAGLTQGFEIHRRPPSLPHYQQSRIPTHPVCSPGPGPVPHRRPRWVS